MPDQGITAMGMMAPEHEHAWKKRLATTSACNLGALAWIAVSPCNEKQSQGKVRRLREAAKLLGYEAETLELPG